MSAAAELPPVDPGVLARLRAYGRVVQAAGDLLATLDPASGRPGLPLEADWPARRLDRAVRAAQQASTTPLPVAPAWPLRHAALDRAQAELGAWLATQAWADPRRGPYVYVYLLCFRDAATLEHRPYRGRPRVGNGGQAAGHYTGSTIQLPRRISEHLADRNSVPLLEAALQAGLTFALATWRSARWGWSSAASGKARPTGAARCARAPAGRLTPRRSPPPCPCPWCPPPGCRACWAAVWAWGVAADGLDHPERPEACDLRGLCDRAAEILESEVVSGLRRRFGDAVGADRDCDGLRRWAAALAGRQTRQPDGSVRLEAGEVDGVTRLLDAAHTWLAAVARVRGAQAAGGLPERLPKVAAGLSALLGQAHAGPDPTVTTLGRPADPDAPTPREEHP
jgi:hypothetical protein